MFVLPHLGAAQKTMIRLATMQTEAQVRKPGAMKNFLNSLIVDELCCSGAFSARMTAPMIHNAQPIQPYH